MDHTKKTTFAAFVNIHKGDKFWVDGHYEFSQDAPTLFRFNTKEEKNIAQEVAQSYLDNWGFEAVELVVFEVKSRHLVNLKKRTEAQIEEARKKNLAASDEFRKAISESDSTTTSTTPVEPVTQPKKRGRKPKAPATI